MRRRRTGWPTRRERRPGRPRAAARGNDLEAEHHRIHRERALRTGTRADGASFLSANGTAEDIATIKAHLAPFAKAAFERARKENRHEPYAAYDFDALVAMAKASTGQAEGRTPAKVLVRVDYEALCRGVAHDEELCEIDGVGPVPVSVAKRIADDAFLVGVLTKGTDVTKVIHFGRKATVLQESAIEWRSRWCDVLDCTRGRTELHHEKGWASTRETKFDELKRLCTFHHDLITYKGYRLLESDVRGRLRLLTADDPDPPPD